MKKRTIFAAVFAALFLLSVVTGCGSKASSDQRVVKVGVNGDEIDLWTIVQKKLDADNIKVELIKFNDYVQPNKALHDGEIDLNVFQTITYMNQFKRDHQLDIVAIGSTAIAPMGVYSKKHKQLSEIPDGATITIPNDVTNSIRALKLLQSANLIKLKPNYDPRGGIEQIAENPKNLIIEPVTAGHTARTLDDAAAAVINNGIAVQAKLDPAKDPLYKEDPNDVAAKPYINVIAARTKDKDNQDFAKIVQAVQSKEVQQYRIDRDKGAVIPVNVPIEDIQDL
ncbi:MetQ/NlpA family ABC transporter substrate-binding protein [Paenibacillus sp. 481]|uniref:MetQ/NlpA family ABC transporter substrate-binding protein n=1 Tax=Paenibacillus sp. 481 TaxID=2835869 RepID=UPI001E510878|nr:MetQ/NlpA family ABC transporter substrate-binding protein [Paenibacillus sp. 481]UHA73025.1 MetQ/NlpA family ABC transporter substrate-binding protein [Paenibacillus sp. 481]